jgi:hypothetical protein
MSRKMFRNKKNKKMGKSEKRTGSMIVFAGMFNCRAPDAPSLDFFHMGPRDLNPSVVYGSGRPYLSATRRVQRKYMKIVGYI